MTTVANIKGYINGEEWGVYEPVPSLLTWEEIVAMATEEYEEYPNNNLKNTIALLNQRAEEYYDMLNEQGHLTNYFIDGINIFNYGIKYNSGIWIRYSRGK